jgi:hypothetical protein
MSLIELPLDILEMITQYLHMSDVVSLLRTNKKFSCMRSMKIQPYTICNPNSLSDAIISSMKGLERNIIFPYCKRYTIPKYAYGLGITGTSSLSSVELYSGITVLNIDQCVLYTKTDECLSSLKDLYNLRELHILHDRYAPYPALKLHIDSLHKSHT